MANRARRSLESTILWLGLALAAAGCAGDAPATADRLEVRQPRATLLTPDMGVAYLTVVNPGPAGDRLLRVETGAARLAETHETVEENGVMRMLPRPEGFEVPAGGTLELQPGGKHIMLVEPRAPEGASRIGLTLHFERAGAIQVEAALSPVGEMP
ncbi:MAG TPA: copper chaperone PCu(A)C [Thermoanaerobaculia bacterium]|nr:copper chaperone PCu(A)C [Thermoanaerobaculia bacterium]